MLSENTSPRSKWCLSTWTENSLLFSQPGISPLLYGKEIWSRYFAASRLFCAFPLHLTIITGNPATDLINSTEKSITFPIMSLFLLHETSAWENKRLGSGFGKFVLGSTPDASDIILLVGSYECHSLFFWPEHLEIFVRNSPKQFLDFWPKKGKLAAHIWSPHLLLLRRNACSECAKHCRGRW